jgi:MerR family transcriptional regulator, light-induced transcriptional regulator
MTDTWMPNLVDAAVRLDFAPAVDRMRKSITEQGVMQAWDQVILPLRTEITDAGDDTAHRLLDREVSLVLAAVRRLLDRTAGQVLLAGAEGETDDLPLDALGTALAQAGIGNTVLGGNLPARSLAAAAARLRPRVIVVWSGSTGTADSKQIAELTTRRPGVAVFCAGPGWDAAPVSHMIAAVAGVRARLA